MRLHRAVSLHQWISIVLLSVMACLAFVGSAAAQSAISGRMNRSRSVSRDLLSDSEWKRIEASVDRGLSYLNSQRTAQGTYQRDLDLDPGITGLCMLAFLSRGHLPGQGPYGKELEQTVQYILDCQRPDGMISKKVHFKHSAYSHPICALVLSELYGMAPPTDAERIRTAINQALKFTSRRLSQPKVLAAEEGSWRYLERQNNRDGDLSITSWNMVFLRSAKNAGFDVDPELIEEGLAYVKRMYSPKSHSFYYVYNDPEIGGRGFNRSMAGAGILSLSLAGEHHTEMAQNAARFLLDRPFNDYEIPRLNPKEFLTYGAFYSSVAMFQMGGEYWEGFYPQLAKVILETQHSNGSWHSQRSREAKYGSAYTTSLTILALTPPYQMLPVFQR